MMIEGTGYLLPTNLWVCIQLRRPDPDVAKINRVMGNFFFCRWCAGGDAGPYHRHHGPFRDWPVSPSPFQVACQVGAGIF